MKNFNVTDINVESIPTNTITKYQPHELAEIFPLASKSELDLLRASIQDSGQKHPIIIYEGKILDGRNRYRVCQILGIEPKIEIFEGTYKEARKYSTELNVARRHTTKSQKAISAAQMVIASREGKHQKVSVDHAATMFNVSKKYINRAINIVKVSANIGKNVFNGVYSINHAEKLIFEMESEEKQRSIAVSEIEKSVPAYPEDESYSYEEQIEYQEEIQNIRDSIKDKSRDELLVIAEKCLYSRNEH